MKFAVFSIFAAIAFAWLAPAAQAATTVYVDSTSPLYGGFPNAVNSANALGAPDGAFASVPTGGFIAFQVTPLFANVDFHLEFTGVSGAGIVRLYVGRTNGAGGFTALASQFFTVTPGVFNFNSPALSSYCGGLGGCDTYVTQAWSATSFALDSVAAPSPEPSVWVLMIIGFAGVAARLKTLRGRARRDVPAWAFAPTTEAI